MTREQFKNLKIGDSVVCQVTLKCHYGEVWHNAGDIVKIKRFTDDGIGVIFEWSHLGTTYKNIELVQKQTN